jgi:hypothetical protein
LLGSGEVPATASAAEIVRGKNWFTVAEIGPWITMKLRWVTFAATFFLARLAAMELKGVVLEEI